MQHRNIADEVALPARGKDLLRTFPCFEDFGFAAQDNRQAEIALPCFEDKFATSQRAPLSEWLEQRELAIVEFRKRDALRIAVKLVVLVFVSHNIDYAGKSRNSAAALCSLRAHARVGQNGRDCGAAE